MNSIAKLVDLADSLNLLETIHVNKSQQTATTEQHLKYAIVVDFEATCWSIKTLKSPEIIEFPAVLVDLQNGRIIDEFHCYVQPSESTQLSAFCTELTGIQQDWVDRGEPISKVLPKFHKWLKQTIAQYRLILPKTSATNKVGNTVFVTWSDWDFGVCLKQECDRKRLTRPVYFDQWMDLRALYRSFYNNKAKSFGDALRNVGMSFTGRPHSGIDDARNTARLAHRMFNDGCALKVTKDLKPFLIFNKIE